jgi:hypothetical protein
MIGVFDEEAVRAAAQREPPLESLGETEHEWLLGLVHLDKHHPAFRVGYGAGLSPESHFRKVAFMRPDGARAVAAVFHQLTSSQYSDKPAEYFAGWVPAEREAALDEWISFLNERIARHLAA